MRPGRRVLQELEGHKLQGNFAVMIASAKDGRLRVFDNVLCSSQ